MGGGTTGRWKRQPSSKQRESAFLSTEQLQDYLFNVQKTTPFYGYDLPKLQVQTFDKMCSSFQQQEEQEEGALPLEWMNKAADYFFGSRNNNNDNEKVDDDTLPSSTTSSPLAQNSLFSLPSNHKRHSSNYNFSSRRAQHQQHRKRMVMDEDQANFSCDESEISVGNSSRTSLVITQLLNFEDESSIDGQDDDDDWSNDFLSVTGERSRSSSSSLSRASKRSKDPLLLSPTVAEENDDDVTHLKFLNESYSPVDFQRTVLSSRRQNDPLELHSSAAAADVRHAKCARSRSITTSAQQVAKTKDPQQQQQHQCTTLPGVTRATMETPLQIQPETPMSALTESPFQRQLTNQNPFDEEENYQCHSTLLNQQHEEARTHKKYDKTEGRLFILSILLFLILSILGVLFALEPWRTATTQQANIPQDSSFSVCQAQTNILSDCVCSLQLSQPLSWQISKQRESILESLLSNHLISDDIVQEFLANERSCNAYNQALLFASDLSFAVSTSIRDLQTTLLQRYVLALVYQNLHGRNWIKGKDTWVQPSRSECEWTGVICSSDSGQILKLLLEKNQLHGGFPTELTLLPGLKHLDLSHNPSLVGTLPLDWTTAPRWQFLDLSATGLYGTIPTELHNMTRLYELTITDTRLEGTIPTEIGHLTQLRSLDLSHNSLSGTLPDKSWNNLRQLHTLDVSHNSLTGSLPSSWKMPYLEYLKLNDNLWTGWMPDPLYGSFLQHVEVQPLSVQFVPSSYCSTLPLLDTLLVQCDANMEKDQCPCCTCWRD